MKITQNSTDSETMQELGKRLQRYRIDSGLSQNELSDMTGISSKTIANLEDGKQTNTLTLIRIPRPRSNQRNHLPLTKPTSQRANRSTSCQRDGSFGRSSHYLPNTIKGTVLLMVSIIIYLILNKIPHQFSPYFLQKTLH